MTPAEVSKVLTKCAAYDQRTIGQGDVLAWHEILYTAELADALDAVRRHYRASSNRAMPADILNHSRDAKRDRQRRDGIRSEALALESRFTAAAGKRAAPAFQRTADARAEARQRIAAAQRKFASAHKAFATAEDALAALDQALAELPSPQPELAKLTLDLDVLETSRVGAEVEVHMSPGQTRNRG